MVYEKYIKKNGKLYGPYTYHSRRVNGKVVSEYHGTQKKSSHRNFVWLFLGILFLIILVFGFLFFNSKISGKVSLDLDSNYIEGESLNGFLSLSLREGELIPASSKVIFEMEGNSYEYILSDIVTEEIIKGDFYVEDKSILGGGEGYGVIGTKKIYPQVSFILNVLEEKSSSDSKNSNIEEIEEQIELNEKTETQTEVLENVEKNIEEEEEIQEVSEEIIQEEKIETISQENQVLESNEISESSESSDTSSTENLDALESPTDTISESSSETTITGGIIRGIFASTFNFFQTMTGQASLKLTKEVQGSVSFGESFNYDLLESETAEIKSGSVNIDGKLIEDSAVHFDVINKQVIVTTDYSVEEEGFGQDYLGSNKKVILINLSKLNLIPENENIKISFIYDSVELVSISNLNQETSEEEIIEIPTDILNVTEDLENKTMTNDTKENIIIVSSEFLTDNEKEILLGEYGNISVEITKAEKINGRIEVTFEFQSYSTKHSYDSKLDKSELAEWIERDRIRFLKDVVGEILKTKEISEPIDGIIGSYPI
ncbi:MAG: hypothetical protein ABFQ65_04340 [Nanoarchaeota archaeon]